MNISDLCTGIIVLPLVVVTICLTDAYRSCEFELSVQFISLLFAYFSFFMLMCISIDRYIHITKLNKYSQFINIRRMKIATVVSFIFSVFIAYLQTSIPQLWLQLMLGFSGLIGVLLMFFLYSSVFRKLAIHTENFQRMLEELGTGRSTIRETKKELSATKTIRFVLGALLVLYIPYNVCSVPWSYYKYDRKVNPPFFFNVILYWSCIIVFSNAAINAIILCYANSVVRRFIFSKFCHVGNQVIPIGVSRTVKISESVPIDSQHWVSNGSLCVPVKVLFDRFNFKPIVV